MLETGCAPSTCGNDSQLTGMSAVCRDHRRADRRALKVLAAKAQLPAVEARLVARSLDSQYKYMSTLQHIDGNARC